MDFVVFHQLARLREPEVGLAGGVLDDQLDLAITGLALDLVEI
jgi:hypothetical protein